MRISFWSFLLILALSVSAPSAKADTIDMSGNLSSDSTAVSPTDPVITNPSTINMGDSLSMVLTYDPTGYTQSGNSYVFTSATFDLSFDGYSFDYSSAAGNYIEMSTPGVFGSGTVSFLICTSLSGCSSTPGDYYSGNVTSPATLAAQASGLSGNASASPSEFEFLRNFSDGSQTDLQGTLNRPSAPVSSVPEPGTFTLFASGLAGLAALRRRFRRS